MHHSRPSTTPTNPNALRDGRLIRAQLAATEDPFAPPRRAPTSHTPSAPAQRRRGPTSRLLGLSGLLLVALVVAGFTQFGAPRAEPDDLVRQARSAVAQGSHARAAELLAAAQAHGVRPTAIALEQRAVQIGLLLDIAEEHLTRGELARAETLLANAEALDPDATRADALRRRLDQLIARRVER